MQLKISDYSRSEPDVLFMLQGKYDNISMAAVATNVPVVIVAHMLGRAQGYDAQLNQLITVVMDFYKIDEIIFG
jgi:hypothetical protein